MKVTLGLVLAGLLLFGASFNDPFHFDDTLITNDSNVTNPARWAHFFNPLHLRQITFFSFYLNHLIGGLNPAGYHVVNVAIHIANAVLLYWLMRRFFEPYVAIAAAALFLVHPIQTEPVLYIYERSTLLACLFSLLGIWTFLEKRYWLTALMFLCAFESKESAVAVPLVLALLYLPSPAAQAPRARAICASAAIVLAIAALFLLASEKTVGLSVGVSPLRYLLTQTRVIFTYLRLLVIPYPQSLEYEFQNAGNVLSMAGITGILVAGWLLRHRVEGWCILAFLILLAPTSSILPSADAAFEHRLYLPMLAFSILAAYLISKIPQRTWITAAILLVLSVLTLRRETVWSSDVALWEDTAKRAPGKARVWFNLGGAYLDSNPDKAHAAFLRTLELEPHFTKALYDLGVIEQQKGNWSLALAYYQRAVMQDPDYWPALNNMGNTLFGMGERAQAVEYFSRTLRLNPDYWPAQYNIAIVHFMSGRYLDAVPKLQIVLDWRPDFREARYLLATSLTRSGYRAAADKEWKRLGEMDAAESRRTPAMILAPSRP